MSGLLSLSNLVYVILGIATIIGSVLVLRRGAFKAANEAMEQLNTTLNGEISSLRRRVDDLERERATQDQVIATIRYALRQYGLRVTIAGDFVTLKSRTGESKITRIKQPDPKEEDEDEDAI